MPHERLEVIKENAPIIFFYSGRVLFDTGRLNFSRILKYRLSYC